VNASSNSESDSPIEIYLDQLVLALSSRRPRELRHLLTEADAHLHDDAEQDMARGVPKLEAEANAVARFGPAASLAAAERFRSGVPFRILVRQVVCSAVLLLGIGAVAVGASGAIAAGIRAIGGPTAVADLRGGQVLSPSDCARWLEQAPSSVTSCRQAAIDDWAAEAIYYRLAAGVLGGVCLLGYGWARSRSLRRQHWVVLPPSVTDTIAVTAFGAAGLYTLWLGIDALITSSGRGWGQWLSAAPIALVAAGVFGWRLVDDLRSTA
jgi:hypothetical protein